MSIDLISSNAGIESMPIFVGCVSLTWQAKIGMTICLQNGFGDEFSDLELNKAAQAFAD